MRKFAGPLTSRFPWISRIPVLAAVTTILLIVGIGTLRQGNPAAAWHRLHLPATSPHFMDTHTITNSIDCVLTGQDPYTVRTFDPWNRLYNYPPIWLDLRYLGITSRSSTLMGTTLAVLAAASCLLLFRATTWAGAAIVFLALTSRAILFGLERGNVDEFVFALLVFGFFLIDRLAPDRNTLNGVLSGLLIAVLTILKIYPVVGAIIFLRKRNGLLKTILIVAVSIATLLITSGHKLFVLLANTPRDYMMSFGSFPFFLAIINTVFPSAQSHLLLHPNAAVVGAIVLAALSLAAVLLFRNQLDQLFSRLDFDHARGRIAICCLAIFCFAFITGASYNYRLLFLLGPLACLVEDLNSNQSRRSLLIAAPILFLMWAPFKLTMIHEIPDGLVFVLAITWLGTSLFPSASQSEGAALPQLRTLQSS
jgi:Glycosyltransferase family 87